MTKKKSRGTAIALGLFLGQFGAHKFYLGQIAIGIIYAAFFWTFIPTFIALCDVIYYIALGKEKFDAKYNVPQV